MRSLKSDAGLSMYISYDSEIEICFSFSFKMPDMHTAFTKLEPD
jgi:hypothetical protein